MKKIIFLATLFASLSTLATANCADDMAELDALTTADFSVVWQETTANDNKPMLLKLSDRSGKLYFVFEKTREGVWAEGAAQVCKAEGGLLVTMDADDIKLGPKAPFPVKMAMRGGARFRVRVKSPTDVHVSTSGWNGDFEPK